MSKRISNLEEELQAMLTTWNGLGQRKKARVNDFACLTVNGTCEGGEARDRVLISDAYFENARGILIDKFLPDCAERAYDDGATH